MRSDAEAECFGRSRGGLSRNSVTGPQGLASSTRFTTPELDGLAAALEDASAQARRAEQAVFVKLSAAAMASREALTRIAHAAAALDLVAGLAQAAAEGRWSEPGLAGDTGLDIEGGRHPMAEALLEAEGRALVATDCRMDGTDRVRLLTDPTWRANPRS